MNTYGYGIKYTEQQLDTLHYNFEKFKNHDYLPDLPRIEVIDQIILGNAFAFFDEPGYLQDPIRNALILTSTYEETMDLANHVKQLFTFEKSQCEVNVQHYNVPDVGVLWGVSVSLFTLSQPRLYYFYFLKKSKMYAFSEQAHHYFKFNEIYWATTFFANKDMYCVQLFSLPDTELWYSKLWYSNKEDNND